MNVEDIKEFLSFDTILRLLRINYAVNANSALEELV